MNLPDTKQLKKIVQLCRSQGIKVFELGELRITLTDEAPAKRTRAQYTDNTPKTSIQKDTVPDAGLSEEELLFYSAGGPPDLTGMQ